MKQKRKHLCFYKDSLNSPTFHTEPEHMPASHTGFRKKAGANKPRFIQDLEMLLTEAWAA